MTEEEQAPAEPAPEAAPAEGGETPAAPISKLEEARQLVKALERVNNESRKWIERAEKLRANDILGGESEAGMAPKVKTKEQEAEEEVKKMFEGTGLDPTA